MNSAGMENDRDAGVPEEAENTLKSKKRKRGIVYLSSIPKYMTMAKIRELFSLYGTVGRMYLQLAENELERSGKPRKKKKLHLKSFTEGWVEFESKRVAKYVAATLNNTQISSKKKSKFYDVIWNIKYLPRFKWIHLNERLAYEQAVRKQRLRAEISQAKREANFYAQNVEHGKRLHRKRLQNDDSTFIPPVIRQRDTDAEIRSRKENDSTADRTKFLESLFG